MVGLVQKIALLCHDELPRDYAGVASMQQAQAPLEPRGNRMQTIWIWHGTQSYPENKKQNNILGTVLKIMNSLSTCLGGEVRAAAPR